MAWHTSHQNAKNSTTCGRPVLRTSLGSLAYISLGTAGATSWAAEAGTLAVVAVVAVGAGVGDGAGAAHPDNTTATSRISNTERSMISNPHPCRLLTSWGPSLAAT